MSDAISVLVRLVLTGKAKMQYEEGVLTLLLFEYGLELAREEEEALLKEGWRISYAAFAACGYASLERQELEGGKVKYILYPCFCHPTNYAIVISKRVRA